MQRSAIILLFALGFSSPALSSPAALKHVPNAQKVGEGRLSVAFWDVYDATLYAPNGQWSPDAPYALSIRYFREIEGTDIAERSIEEMKKQGFTDNTALASWNTQMRNIFPNTKNGTELTALFTSNKTTEFYHNGKRIGVIKDPLFGKQFFDIWLNKKTSEPSLRKALLGLS
jgi:Chalcone isomerase-like